MSAAVPRVLVADNVEAIAAFRRALTSPFEVVPATRLAEAQAALLDPPSVVVCGCHFDEGHMYDLLRHMKATRHLKGIPFVAVRVMEGELDDPLYESVKIAVRALGGNAFVDLLRWQRKHGLAEANHRLTRLLETLAQQAPTDSV